MRKETKRMKHKRLVSLLLVFALLAGLLPAVTLGVSAADTPHAITVSASAPATAETTQGIEYKLAMSEIFTDSAQHEMTYTLSGEGLSTQTKITQNKDDGNAMYLFFVQPDVGTYAVTITAACKEDETVTASHTITVTVKEGKDGDPSQYNYNETDAASVTVYVTVSSDGVPLMGKNGEVLAHLPVKVPYFDLANQGLERFYRYQTEGGRGDYINHTLVRRPTALHLYLYLLGVYYLGLSPEEVTSGEVKIQGHAGSAGVRNMNGDEPYTDSLKALNITGDPTSLYMQQFWGHDENLMYYRNHVYPLMGINWGSTADYILLSDGDTIDVAMFSNWDFYKNGGAFVCFDQDSYTATTKNPLSFRTQQFGTQSVADGGTGVFEPATGLSVLLCDSEWNTRDVIEPEKDNQYTLDTSNLKPGTYYLLALDPHAGEPGKTSKASKAPATAVVTVTDGETCKHETTEVRGAKEATCGADGYTGDTWCTVCGQKLKTGETIPATGKHADSDGDGKCDVCGAAMTAAVPTRKASYPAESSGVVKTNMAYLLSDLQAGRVFDPVDGQKLTYRDYYYERSTDGGATWSTKQSFPEAIFGATTICMTETTPGVYMYRFYASHDGVHFSTDTWTLTLTVSEAPVMDFSFYVGKDYTGGYPIIRLYSVGTDENGDEMLGTELQDVFLYSNFTTTCPDGTEDYDPNEGILTNNYQMFYASLAAGRYAYRAFAKNAETGAYDIPLGGMTLEIPTDANVDGQKSGGTNLYLQCVSFYTTSKKADGTYFTADEYRVSVDCPIMKCQTQMGRVYQSGDYAMYPTVLYASGNACLYNYYLDSDLKEYAFSQGINATFQPTSSAVTKSASISAACQLTVTVPEDASFGLYFQRNNFNSKEVAPEWIDEETPNEERWQNNGDGTKTARYLVSKGNSNYTWRLSDDAHVTQSGWLQSLSDDREMTLTYAADAATDRLSHDFSMLGAQTAKRDEADLQVNLDPSGFKVINQTTRVRAYRHWQLINSDTANIMVEPDYHWDILDQLGGNAKIEPVNGGNGSSNWANITPGTQDSFIFVHYDSIDMNPGDYGSHGGLYPATNPERTGVIVVGGTGVTHGTADAKVAFGFKTGVTITRSMDWDYNYDTWFYTDTDNELTFTVSSTGTADVSYCLLGFTDAFDAESSGWSTAAQSGDGYTVPLKSFDSLGNGRGGTVILRMKDATGVSYRLVRAAKVTYEVENLSHAGDPVMPGDKVRVTFDGLYRSVNKVAGIFNPTGFALYYSVGDTPVSGALPQYERMDNTAIELTIPADLEFADGAKTALCTLKDGYINGSMYAAANPFQFLYNMSDVGVGTNFNAVTVQFFMSRWAEIAIEVNEKVSYAVKIVPQDASGNALTGASVAIFNAAGVQLTPDETGCYSLGYGTYYYQITSSGSIARSGSFTLTSASAGDVSQGVLTKVFQLENADASAWDGQSEEPAKDSDGTYLIGTGEELAWFASAVNGGQTAISGRLTADIELTGVAWTPIGSSANPYNGTFDGGGHVVKNLFIHSGAAYQALFGSLGAAASITKLGVTGSVITTGNYAGGIAAYAVNGAAISECFNAAAVIAAKWAGGICGYTQSTVVTITDCYNTGAISASGADGFAGGITACGNKPYLGAALTNCYNTGTVTAETKLGALTARTGGQAVTNSYYLSTSCPNATAKKGTAKTEAELKALAATLGKAFSPDTASVNSGYPILAWQVSYALGDVNGDGKISAKDAALLYAYVNGRTTLTAEQLSRCDVSGDGKVTAKDAALIYSYVNGRITVFPAESK